MAGFCEHGGEPSGIIMWEISWLAEELFAFARTVFHAVILLVTDWTIKWQQ